MPVYRLSDTDDPEERLEDACMAKALRDEWGDELTILPPDAAAPDGKVPWGRLRRSERPVPPSFPYWDDPGFLATCGRRVEVGDLDRARAVVGEIHARGADAFAKAARDKYWCGHVPLGTTLADALGDVAIGVAGHGIDLIVQERLTMTHERRFLFVGGLLVTSSPVAWHLTPLDRERLRATDGFRTPRDPWEDVEREPDDAPLETAWAAFDASPLDTICVDVARVDAGTDDERCVTVEFNPLEIGRTGLYACDPRALARATRRMPPASTIPRYGGVSDVADQDEEDADL